MRIPQGVQTQRDRNHARDRLKQVEEEIRHLRAQYFVALPLRDNETMDRCAAQIREKNAEAERLRRVLLVGA